VTISGSKKPKQRTINKHREQGFEINAHFATSSCNVSGCKEYLPTVKTTKKKKGGAGHTKGKKSKKSKKSKKNKKGR
jgi:hypothetical protein